VKTPYCQLHSFLRYSYIKLGLEGHMTLIYGGDAISLWYFKLDWQSSSLPSEKSPFSIVAGISVDQCGQKVFAPKCHQEGDDDCASSAPTIRKL